MFLKCSEFITCLEPRYPCRFVHVRQVARPQLPVAVGAPAFDAALSKAHVWAFPMARATTPGYGRDERGLHRILRDAD